MQNEISPMSVQKRDRAGEGDMASMISGPAKKSHSDTPIYNVARLKAILDEPMKALGAERMAD